MINTEYVPGAPAWIDLGTSDEAKAAEFYSGVLGWEYRPLDTPGTGVFTCGGRTVAGQVASQSGSWTVHFAGTGPEVRLTDPQGGEFGVWQGPAGLEVVSAPGSLTWLELHSPAPSASAAFYRSLFSWEIEIVEGAPGQFLRPAGTGQGRLFGSIVADAQAFWLPYFEVTDVDQAAASAPVLLAPHDLDGVGRIAVLVDPFGARFGVMRSVTS
ncbi:VOC family protein [Lentzea cavernae]|uniref:Hydroxylase n=1 Tax=Lentzea cavernae TaxID=2020703 RepID=A0ABQ3MRU5_9PSEU|nr:VOC family protein [Lentzea cavernae]GHH56237.1 hydroxylase [Lentzea cavernae]